MTSFFQISGGIDDGWTIGSYDGTSPAIFTQIREHCAQDANRGFVFNHQTYSYDEGDFTLKITCIEKFEETEKSTVGPKKESSTARSVPNEQKLSIMNHPPEKETVEKNEALSTFKNDAPKQFSCCRILTNFLASFLLLHRII